jgi:hypothetical protein
MKYLIVIALSFTSCASLKKTLIYSALSGGLAGSATGIALSPDKASRGANAAVFGLIGAGIVAMSGYALYQDDPRNYKLKHMLMDKKEIDSSELELGLGDLKIDANLEKKEAYRVPVTELPKELQGKVNKQYLIKYQSKERYVKKGNKTFYIPSFEVFEHAYDEKIEGEKQ